MSEPRGDDRSIMNEPATRDFVLGLFYGALAGLAFVAMMWMTP